MKCVYLKWRAALWSVSGGRDLPPQECFPIDRYLKNHVRNYWLYRNP